MTQNELTKELRMAWNKKLYQYWEYYNDIYLAEALTRPVIQISKSEQKLGSWNGARRLLTISEFHIRQHPWLSVMEILRHEMAHQYVQEVLKVEDEFPHGPAFKHACERLRCRPCARATPEDLASEELPRTEEDRLLLKIKKLLALADSPNENEAQAAMKKAHDLLFKHNIDIVELDKERIFGIRCLGKVKGRRASYDFRLASILNEFFFVEVIWQWSYDAQKNKSGVVLQIHGTLENLDMAEYVYTYLLNVLGLLWAEYKGKEGLSGPHERDRYFLGLLIGFYQKLHAQQIELKEALRHEKSLIWKGDAKLKEFFQHHHPKICSTRPRGIMPTQAYFDGISKGHQITISRPIEDHRVEFGGYLPERSQ